VSEIRSRREPPPFRAAEVVRTEARSPWLVRITLAGEELAGLEAPTPAASVRLLLPGTDGTLEMPTWNGNEFLLADDSRPRLRTVTPLRFDAEAGELDIEVVLHGESPLTVWARDGGVGAPVAVSGTGRGHEVDVRAAANVLLGDESATPALSTLLPGLAGAADVQVVVEVRDDEAAVDLGEPAGTTVDWRVAEAGAPPGAALYDALVAMELPEDVRVWAAGEAAGVQRLRKYLFEEVGLDRRRAAIRGYWKAGRAEGGT